MREQGGFLWPDSDKTGATAILSHAARHFPAMLQFVRGRDCAIQAGGNVGVYPKHLAREFAEVLTFEPDADNFACMEKNLAGVTNVRTHRLALGAAPATVGLDRHPENAGAHRIVETGSIDMVTIDSLDLAALDLIWLDAEGYEPEILSGADGALARFRPVVIFEDMGLGYRGKGYAERVLEARGYRKAGQILHDIVMVPGPA